MLNSVAVLHDLNSRLLFYRLAAVRRVADSVSEGQIILRSGSSIVSTSGLDWITFGFAPLALLTGQGYHIEFSFDGNANGNFFHNNCIGPGGPVMSEN